ncbi:MAG: WD40 repeat domain-containing protein [Terracidiphilus sp.]|jgi:WD40 repeat protein
MAQVASGEVIACAWSPDGRSVLTGGREGAVRLWDVATGAELKLFQGEAWIRNVAFSSDHQRVVSVSSLDEKTSAQLWDVTTGKELGRISPPAGKLIFGIVSPNGSTVATARPAETDEQGNKLAAGGATRIQLWNLLTGKEIRHFLVPGAYASGTLLLSPDGSKLLTGDFDGPRLWNVGTGKLLRQFWKPDGVVNAAAFSADGHSLAWGTVAGTVHMWDAETGKEIQHFAGDYPADYMATVNSVSISRDGRRLLTGSNDGRARLWDVETGKDLQRFAASDKGPNTAVNCAALSPDGHEVLTASDDRTARLWDVETGTEIHRLVGGADQVAALAFSDDGRGIVAASRTGMVWRWDAESGKGHLQPLQTSSSTAAYTSAESDITTVVLTPDGRRVFMNSLRGDQAVWDVESGKELQLFDPGINGTFSAVDFSPVGSKMLATSHGPKFSLWDVETGREIQHFTVNPGLRPRLLYPEGDYRDGVERLALSPDGRKALTSDSEGSTRLWDVKTRSQIRALKVHTYNSLAIGFSPDSLNMVTENFDGSASLLGVKRGNEIQHFAKASRPSFAADGNRVLMGSSVWEVKTGKELRHFDTPFGTEPVEKLSPDGRKVLIGSGDGTTKLWDLETGKKLASLYGFQDGSWAVVDPEGRFDADKIEGNAGLHWVIDSDPARVLPLATFKDGHYTPGLLKHILSGEDLPPMQ